MITTEIPGGLSLGATTVTAAKILNGYTLYNGDGQLLTGTALDTVTTATKYDLYPGKTAYNSNGELMTGVEILPLGGQVFYDNGSNGATYTFFDSSKNIITDTSISGLANAVYYAKEGTSSVDRWYIYYPTLINSEYYCWSSSYDAVGVTNTGIGYGKPNTATCMNLYATDSATVWYKLKSCRDSKYGSCNDWFLPTNQEHSALANSGLVAWYTYTTSPYRFWTSTEIGTSTAYRCNGTAFSTNSKTSNRPLGVIMRAI